MWLLDKYKAIVKKLKNCKEGKLYSDEGMNQTHQCMNCGLEYQGNFCPRCSQSHKVKRFTLKSVLSGVLEVFDYNNRSVLKTLIELLYRPGYLIRDYMSGKRASYYPPIKLLFFTTLILVLVLNFDFIKKDEFNLEKIKVTIFNNKDSLSTDKEKEVADIADINIKEKEEVSEIITEIAEPSDNFENSNDPEVVRFKGILYKLFETYLSFSRNNMALTIMFSLVLLTLFFRLLFRKPPFGKLNLTEHFYALVYVQVAMTFLSIIYILITREYSEKEIIILPFGFVLAYYTLTYKQLFGYGWFKTFFKILFAYILNWISLFILLLLVLAIIAVSISSLN